MGLRSIEHLKHEIEIYHGAMKETQNKIDKLNADLDEQKSQYKKYEESIMINMIC